MKIMFSKPTALTLALFRIFCVHVSAQIPVNVDDLDPLKECKRREVKLFESDNKVYIYGGQSWVKNGTETPYQITNHYLRVADFTTSRDLSDSAILTAHDIPGDITIYQTGAFWADSKKVYVVGGTVNDNPWISRSGKYLQSNYTSFKGDTIFSYEISTDKWTSEAAVQPSSGAGVTDTFANGAFAFNEGNGKAYYFSGNNQPGARRLTSDDGPIYVGRTNEETRGNGNLLTFDPATYKWTNDTTNTQLTTTGTENGQLVYLPGTESSSGGIAIHLGGIRRDESNPDANSEQMESMRKVLVFDSGSKEWYGQATTSDGDFPSGRWYFCAVAASAPDNSSHNIFMYAGEAQDTEGKNAYSDLWILSVPSFKWLKVDGDHPPRKSHGCTTVADKYMVTYGGVPSGWGEEGDKDACDQENYGLRLFDMEGLAWTGKYGGPSQGTTGVKVPKLVYDAIGGGEQGSATQMAPSAGFETAALSTLFPRSSPTSTASGATSTPTNGASPSAPEKKSNNLGAIVGGVLGGIIVILLAILGILWLLKRKKKNAAAMSAPYEVHGQDMYPNEIGGNGQEPKRNVYEMYGEREMAPQEMPAHYGNGSPTGSPLPQHALLGDHHH